jgi:hypothetical protein
VRVTGTITAPETLHSSSTEGFCEMTFNVIFTRAADKGIKSEVRIKKEIINVPARCTIFIDVHQTVSSYAGKSTGPECRTDVSMPSGKEYPLSQGPNSDRTFSIAEKEDIGPPTERCSRGTGALRQYVSPPYGE